MKVLSRLASFALGLSLFLCSIGVSAQITPKPIEAAVMFDEYGRIGGCDHSARLDNLAIEVQNNPNLECYLVYYGPKSASEPTFIHIKDYLINSRGISEERWKTIYAGPNNDPSEPRIQLWVAPRGAPPPELVQYESKVETFTGLFTEHHGWDGVYLGGEDGGTGPGVPGVSLPTFIDMLKERKDTLAYLVAFAGTESAPGAWRRVAERESEELQSSSIASDRIRIIYGGSDKESKETKVQFWILPKTAPPPVADAGPEPPPDNTRQIGSWGDYDLGDERGERWAFKVGLDGLSTSEESRLCIIIHLVREVAAEELEETQDETPLITDVTEMPDEFPEPQAADFFKLIDKWKAELTDKYKIRHDRFIVLFAKSRELQGNTLETWIVPPGALLPDPDAEPVEETADDAKPTEAGKDSREVKPQKGNPPG